MKLNKKTIRIAYWAVRIIAICLALLLFSVTSIVATLITTHAHGLINVHSNQFLDDTPTDTLTVTPSPIYTPSPTLSVPPTPTPAQQPTVIMRRTPPIISTPTKATTPSVITKAPTTTVTLGPSNTTPTVTVKTTPTKTPVSTSTPNTGGIQTPTIPGGIDTHTTTHATSSNTKTTATITPFIQSIIGTSVIILLLAASVLVLVLWKKGVFATLLTRGVAPVQPSPIRASGPAANGQVSVAAYNSYNAFSAEAVSTPSIAQHTMFPFGIQGIAQSSPLLGATSAPQLNTPVSPASSNFNPLLNEASNNQALATMEPTIDTVATQPTLQAASAQAPHTSGPVEAAFRLSQMHTPIPPSLQIMPSTYQFPQQDPFLEALMHEAQMGLFALPGKTS